MVRRCDIRYSLPARLILCERIFCFKPYLAYRGFLPYVICHRRADFPPVADFRLGVGNNERYVDEPGESAWMALATLLNLNVRRREVSSLKLIDVLHGGNGICHWLVNLVAFVC